MKLKRTIAAVAAAAVTASMVSISAIVSAADVSFSDPISNIAAGDLFVQTSTNADGSINQRFVCIINSSNVKKNKGVGMLFNAKGHGQYITLTNAYTALDVTGGTQSLPDGLYAAVFTVYNIPANSNDVELQGAALLDSSATLYSVPVVASTLSEIPVMDMEVIEEIEDKVSEEPSEEVSEEPGVSEEPSKEPDVPSEDPVETSEAPVETSEAPVETSEAPVQTSEAPVQTSEAPVQTSEAPVQTSEAPEVTE